MKEVKRRLTKRRIDKLVPVKDWFAVVHEENDRCTARLVRVHFMAIVYEQYEIEYEEPVADGTVSFGVRREEAHEVYGMVYDIVNGDAGLTFAHELHDFIALCEPGEVRERYWDDMAKERVDVERIEEEQAERRRSPVVELAKSTDDPGLDEDEA